MNSITNDLPFSIVPWWVATADISDNALRVYVMLARYADGDGAAFPSLGTLAKLLGCSVDKIRRGIHELQAAQIVDIQQRFKEGRQTSNLYVIRRVEPQVGVADLQPSGVADLQGTGVADLQPHELNQKELNQKEKHVVASDNITDEFDDKVVHLTRRFAALVKANGHTLPQQNSNAAKQWLVAMDRLLRLGPSGDGGEPLDFDEIVAVMEWALVESDFWPAVLRSVPKFREKWTTIAGQAKRGSVVRKPDTGHEWLEAWGELGEKIRRVGRYAGRPQLPQLLDEYVNMLGGWGRACGSFDAGSASQRAQFRDWWLSRQEELSGPMLGSADSHLKLASTNS